MAVSTMINIVLYEPEIPPNTGNIIRLCANTGFMLHVIEPLGFELDDKKLRRAGLDYGEWKNIVVHSNWQQFLQYAKGQRILPISTKGKAFFHDWRFRVGDCVILGPETRGLPTSVLSSVPTEQVLRIPMRPESRSMNLSNAASVVAFEAWRQFGFEGAS